MPHRDILDYYALIDVFVMPKIKSRVTRIGDREWRMVVGRYGEVYRQAIRDKGRSGPVVRDRRKQILFYSQSHRVRV